MVRTFVRNLGAAICLVDSTCLSSRSGCQPWSRVDCLPAFLGTSSAVNSRSRFDLSWYFTNGLDAVDCSHYIAWPPKVTIRLLKYPGYCHNRNVVQTFSVSGLLIGNSSQIGLQLIAFCIVNGLLQVTSLVGGGVAVTSVKNQHLER